MKLYSVCNLIVSNSNLIINNLGSFDSTAQQKHLLPLLTTYGRWNPL